MIEVRRVRVVVGEVTLLPTVSFTIETGRTLIVRGRNGTGKSTLLRVLAGMREPTSGTASLANARIEQRDPAYRRRVAALIGSPPIASDLTVADHVRLVAATWYDDRDAADERAAATLDRLHLTDLGARFPHELSSGQQQLFGLSLVLARPFEVLILDEPEQRLDPEHIDTVIDALRELHAAGVTLVLATHSAHLAEALAGQTLTLGAAG